MDELAPVTLADAPEGDAPAPKPGPTLDLHDREQLREHRAKLLAAQDLAPGELAQRSGRGAMVGDLSIALSYSAYALPLGYFVLREGARQGHFALSAVIVIFALAFFGMLWQRFVVSYRRMRRARSYEGVLAGKRRGDDAAFVADFAGGPVNVPSRIHAQLVPGVRYRVHAPGTDEMAVDVALDDDVSDDLPRTRGIGAYR